jgi:hypothetical protein
MIASPPPLKYYYNEGKYLLLHSKKLKVQISFSKEVQGSNVSLPSW